MKEFAIFPVLATVNAPQSGFDNSPKIRRVAELSGPQIERIKAAAAVVFFALSECFCFSFKYCFYFDYVISFMTSVSFDATCTCLVTPF